MNVNVPPHMICGYAILVGLNVGLSAMVLDEILSSDQHNVVERVDWKPKLEPVAARPDQEPDRTYALSLERPIFFKTREPFRAAPTPPPRPAVVQAKLPDPVFELGGIVVTDGRKVAYLRTKDSPTGTWLAVGESLSGWRLNSIESYSATLELQGRTIEVHLYD
jgi:hypothetical protein